MTVDVLIIGGGLAGLTAALHLSQNTINVLLIEKKSYPEHKVCGEYVSNEVLPYLKSLGVNPMDYNAKAITKFVLSTTNNKSIETELPLGGFSISRYAFDYALVEKGKAHGVEVVQDTVTDVVFKNDEFKVTTKKNKAYSAKFVIGAYGKRSNLDIQLKRGFIKKRSPFLAVKTHLKGDFQDDLVALHNFNGGYCGLSKVENDHINACYIVDYEAFKTYKNMDEFQEQVVFKNKAIKAVFENSTAVFEKPLTISQISFAPKNSVENHVIMCGDTAGMIHPLCGNGMSMAIQSAQIASQLISRYFNKNMSSRASLEKQYQKEWDREFSKRLKTGRLVSKVFKMKKWSEIAMLVLQMFPSVLPQIIKQTHGKLIDVE